MRSFALSLVLIASACSSSGSTTNDGPLGADAPILTDAPKPTADAPKPTADAPKAVDAAPGGPDAGAPPYPTVTLMPVTVAMGLSQPVAIMKPPGETRYFVAEKTGTISIIGNDTKPITPAFIDIHSNLSMNNYDEEGLLSLVFHPHYDTNGRVFVYFTGKATGSQESDRNVHIWEFHTADGNTATFTKEILDVPHTTQLNHNGGKMIFGPTDGYLYTSIGDGGGGFGSESDTRSVTTRLGKILRLDVDHGDPYQPPADNPFINMASAEAKDVYFWGLRNPWRWSFDRQTHDIWIGDVGQNCWEEIDFVPAGTSGADFGWHNVEGINHATDPAHGTCPTTTMVQPGAIVPVSEYDHSHGNAVVGGYVYRGTAIPEIQGMYFFSDNGAGFIRSFWAAFPVLYAQAKNWASLAESNVSSFDEDPDGELLYCSILGSPNGACYRITRN